MIIEADYGEVRWSLGDTGGIWWSSTKVKFMEDIIPTFLVC